MAPPNSMLATTPLYDESRTRTLPCWGIKACTDARCSSQPSLRGWYAYGRRWITANILLVSQWGLGQAGKHVPDLAITDSMDRSKFQLPRWLANRAPKDLSNLHQPSCELTACPLSVAPPSLWRCNLLQPNGNKQRRWKLIRPRPRLCHSTLPAPTWTIDYGLLQTSRLELQAKGLLCENGHRAISHLQASDLSRFIGARAALGV